MKNIDLNKIIFGFLVFIPIALLAYLFSLPPAWLMIFSALGIVPLSKIIGQATESLANYFGSALGGILNVTFGNATELIIGVLALNKGLTEVAKASITGSILGNLLLVLGTAIFLSGLKYKELKFNQTAGFAAITSLLLALVALVMPAIFYWTAPEAGSRVIEELSIAVAVLLLLAYLGQLFFMLLTHKHLYVEEEAKEEARWSKKNSALILVLSTIFVAILGEIFVGQIESVVKTLGWTELFIGVIFVAILGNVAEHISAVSIALKKRVGLALQITLGSAIQIVMFVAPVLVLISLFFNKPMTLIFRPLELISLVAAVFVSNAIIEDGQTHWFEGLQLLIVYGIIAVAFFLHP